MGMDKVLNAMFYIKKRTPPIDKLSAISTNPAFQLKKMNIKRKIWKSHTFVTRIHKFIFYKIVKITKIHLTYHSNGG